MWCYSGEIKACVSSPSKQMLAALLSRMQQMLAALLSRMQQLRRLDVARCWASDEGGHRYESQDVDGFRDSLCLLMAPSMHDGAAIHAWQRHMCTSGGAACHGPSGHCALNPVAAANIEQEWRLMQQEHTSRGQNPEAVAFLLPGISAEDNAAIADDK